MAKRISTYKRHAKLLKNAKLIDIDLRRNLSPSDKARITRAYKKHKRIADNPGDYAIRKVSRKRANQMKKTGHYLVKNDRVYIDKEGFTEVHIKRNQVVKRRGASVTRHLIIPPTDVVAYLERMSHEKPNAQFALQANDGATWLTSMPADILMRYVRDTFDPKDENETRETLIPRLTVVEVDRKRNV